tara:strand:+ start:114 stop:572 length:459 start_codon:yes stop_codon:yes gene_type:complete
MIVTNRDGSTKFVEGPDEEQKNENVRFLLSRSKKKKGKLNKKVDLNPEDFILTEDQINALNTEEVEEDPRQKEMDAMNAQFQHEDHRMSLEQYEEKMIDDWEEAQLEQRAEEEMIEKQIEYIEECQMGMHGHQPQRYAQKFGTMKGFKGKVW